MCIRDRAGREEREQTRAQQARVGRMAGLRDFTRFAVYATTCCGEREWAGCPERTRSLRTCRCCYRLTRAIAPARPDCSLSCFTSAGLLRSCESTATLRL